MKDPAVHLRTEPKEITTTMPALMELETWVLLAGVPEPFVATDDHKFLMSLEPPLPSRY